MIYLWGAIALFLINLIICVIAYEMAIAKTDDFDVREQAIALTTVDRIDGGEILDEAIAHNATVHMENMGDGSWCIVIESGGDRVMFNAENVTVFERE